MMQDDLEVESYEKVVCESLRRVNALIVEGGVNQARDLFGAIPGRKYVIVVGGWVRDKYMGGRPTDIDLLIPFGCSQLVASNFIMETRNQGASVTRVSSNSLVEGKAAGRKLSRYRVEGFREGSGWEVDVDLREMAEGETLGEDYRTRDFTMNCVYYDLIERRYFDPREVGEGELGKSRHREVGYKDVQRGRFYIRRRYQ